MTGPSWQYVGCSAAFIDGTNPVDRLFRGTAKLPQHQQPAAVAQAAGAVIPVASGLRAQKNEEDLK